MCAAAAHKAALGPPDEAEEAQLAVWAPRMRMRTCFVGRSFPPSAARAVARLLRGPEAPLRRLTACDVWVGDDGAAHLAAALRSNTTLEALTVPYARIGADGVRSLAAALRANTTLRELDLGDNPCGAGLPQLAAALAASGSLLVLKAGGCNRADAAGAERLGPEIGQAFADALAANRALERLDLSNNLMGVRGVAGVADALRRNRSLRCLDVRMNGELGGTAAARALVEALELNCVLMRLDTSCAPAAAALVDRNRAMWRLARRQRLLLRRCPDATLPFLIPDLARIVADYAGSASGEEPWVF